MAVDLEKKASGAEQGDLANSDSSKNKKASDLRSHGSLKVSDSEYERVISAADRAILERELKIEEIGLIKKAIYAIKLADAMHQCFWIGRPDCTTLYANPEYRKVSGYSLEECLKEESDFCFDEPSRKVIAEHRKLRKKGESSQYEGVIVSKDGVRTPVLVNGAPIENGGTIGIFNNLTDFKRLEKQEKILAQVVRNSADGIVLLDNERKIQMWNSGAEEIFGYTEGEVMGKAIEILLPKGQMELSSRIVKQADKKRQVMNVETKRVRKDGELIDVLVSVAKVVDRSGDFAGFLAIYHDITDKKKFGSELQERFEAMQDAYKELGLQKRQLDYLYEIANYAAREDADFRTLCNLMVSSVCLLTQCDGAVMRRFNSEKGELKIVATMGVDSNWQNKGRIMLKGSVIEDAVKRGRPLIVGDAAAWPNYKGVKLLEEHGFKSLVVLPLIFKGGLVASINLYAKNPEKFRFIETDFLENFGNFCAGVLAV